MVKFYLILGLLLFSSNNDQPKHLDPCEEARASAEAATVLSKTNAFGAALTEIQTAFLNVRKEHAVAFGKDSGNNVIISNVNAGGQNNGKVPRISNAFADLHNHPGNHPPDAGDLYGLIDICRKQNDYNTRFIVTQNKVIYALVVINTAAADSFNVKYPRDLSGCSGCSPKFPEAIVDEFREMKYAHGCTDEMALAFILEKYHTGVSLLKLNSNGIFNKLRTSLSRNGTNLYFTPNNCQ